LGDIYIRIWIWIARKQGLKGDRKQQQKKKGKENKKREEEKELRVRPISYPRRRGSREIQDQEIKPKEEDTNRTKKETKGERGKGKRVPSYACVHHNDRSSLRVGRRDE